MRVSVIGYFNSLPYRAALAREGYHIEMGSPRACGLAFARGGLDAALVPVRHAWIFERSGLAKPALPFGIASHGATWSTLLAGPQDLASPNYSTIAVTSESSSAAALCQVVLEEGFGHSSITIVRVESKAECPFLVIGDAALSIWYTCGGRPENMWDIGEIWQNLMGVPFVFARWVVRSDIDSEQIDSLYNVLDRAAESAADWSGVTCPGEAGPNLPEDFLRQYLFRLSFRLQDVEVQGEQIFRDLWHRSPGRLAVTAPPASASGFWSPGRSAIAFVDPEQEYRASRVSTARAALVGRKRSITEHIVSLLTDYPASELFEKAHRRRLEMTDPESVTFIVDSNPNYTNVCDAYCSFCAFYVPSSRSDTGYEHSIEVLLANFRSAVAKGATTILLQGGHHPALPFDYYVELVRRTRHEMPGVMPHFWSAGEIRRMAEISGLSIRSAIRKLYEAGQRSLPGGGAEILSRRVRDTISPLKGPPEDWIEVHRIAHEEGMRSTATMMYGHVEAPTDIAAHLLAVRRLQDETSGFTAFIPWSFKPGSTPLARRLGTDASARTNTYLRVLATARLVLDNFAHIQSSFFSEGWEAGELALYCGADDVGGILIEENVHRAAGYENPTPLNEVCQRIMHAGFRPVQRDTLYSPISSEAIAHRDTGPRAEPR